MKQTVQVQDFPEQELETLEIRLSHMNAIGKLKDELSRKQSERDMIRKKYLEMHIKEASNELNELEKPDKIGYNPYPSRPNVVQPQPDVADNLSEFTDATKVTDNKEEQKAALKEECKANEGSGTTNDIFEDVSTGFSVNSKPFKPTYSQAQQLRLPTDESLMSGKKKRNPVTKQPESTLPSLLEEDVSSITTGKQTSKSHELPKLEKMIEEPVEGILDFAEMTSL